jgi:hypothetical protein
MKNNNDLKIEAQVTDCLTENEGFQKGNDSIITVIPGINRLLEDLRTGYRSGSRIDVQIDWAHGRMALSY